MPDRLSEQHRLAQVRLGALTQAQVLQVFPLLDPTRLDATFEAWLAALVPIVKANRLVSDRLARNYLTAHRANALGLQTDAFELPAAPPLDPKRLRTSLLVTGPVSIRQAMTRGAPIEEATTTAQANTARASMRHSLDGGRELILLAVRHDPRARGYERTTSGSACQFCQGLAGQHAHTEAGASFQAHDGCSCSAAPVYA